MTSPADKPSIGAQVRTLREKKGWSQKELAEKAGLDASLISRLEAGLYDNPRASTTVKLEDALGVTRGYLESSSKAGDDQSETPIRFLIPHSTVAAPFFPLALGGEIEGVKFSSCRGTSLDDELIWLPTEDGVVPDTDPAKIQSFLAVVVRNLLNRGEGDVALVWSESLAAYEGIIKRYAQVVFGLSTLNCLRVLSKGESKKNKCHVFHPSGLEDIVTRYKAQFTSTTTTVMDFSKWPNFVDQVKTALAKDKQVAIFIWEPCISWLKDALKEKGYEYELEMPLGMNLNMNRDEPDEPPIYVVMDIVCKADNTRALQWLEKERDKTGGFFAHLIASIKQLERALQQDKRFTFEPIPMIAKYLHMPPDEVRWRLRRLEFAIRFYD